jgi:hypothetical protein
VRFAARTSEYANCRLFPNFTIPPVSVIHTSPGTMRSIARVSADVRRLTSW